MFVSAFDLFKIGLGPSSSHTVGPMRAALRFVHELAADGKLDLTERVGVDLYGSLALTGRGHGTDRAVLLGLSGEAPDRIDPDTVEAKVHRIRAHQSLKLDGRREITFREQEDLRFRIDKALAFHSNGMRFTAHDATGAVLFRKIYFSVGGGFVVDEAEAQRTGPSTKTVHVPYAFASAAELLEHGNESKKRIAEMMRVNELTLRSPDQVRSGLLERWTVMNDSIERGIRHEGALPASLHRRRRAPGRRGSLRTLPAGAGTTPAAA